MMNSSIRSILATGALLWAMHSAHADAGEKPTVALDFARLGFSSVPSVSDTTCSVAMNLGETTFLAHLDEIKALDILNQNELPNRIDQMPETLAMAFALQVAPSVTEKLYRTDSHVDVCQFTQYLTAPDAAGIERPMRVFSYGFSRAQFDKTDWTTVTSERFIRSTTTLRFDREFQKRLQKEAHPH